MPPYEVGVREFEMLVIRFRSRQTRSFDGRDLAEAV
jgi:hypothetical protein